MKTLTAPIVALLCVACASQGSNETSSNDSTAVDSTAAITQTVSTQEAEQPGEAGESYPDEDISMLDVRYDSCKQAVESLEQIYRVDISTSQYEAGSSVTWYFDTNFKPLYFSMEWSAEGNEGSTELVISDETVICAKNEEYNTSEKWTIQTGGYRLTYGDEESSIPTDSTFLYNQFGDSQNEALQGFLKTLMAVLAEAELVGSEGSNFILKTERVVNYGGEFTETTNVTIDKNLYTEWMGGE
ncbi:MAG TPA: hypothetical protein VFU05_16155 [Cyclobacteriaceae bacterium]|nr:hypothetical protein [Cyclobacteriaceae bacterium]